MADAEDDPVFDADEVGALFKKSAASGNEYNFAFGLASKPELCGLLVDLRKPGQVLKKQLKGASKDIRKVAFGTFTVVSGDVLFRPAKPLKGLVKQLKKRFRDAGMMKYNPVMVDASGAAIDEDALPEAGDDFDDDEAPPAAPPAPETGDAAAPRQPDPGLKDRLVAIRGRIETLPKDQTQQLVAAFAKAVAMVREGDPAAAATVETLERVLDRMSQQAAPAAPPPPQQGADAAARVTAALAALVPRIRALPPEAQAALVQAARGAQALIAAGDLGGAATAIRTLAADLARAEAPPVAPPPPPGTADAVPEPPPQPTGGEAPIDIWNTAKEATDAGIGKLQQALKGLRHPATDRIAEFGLAGLSGGGVQTALTAALMDLSRAAPDARAGAAAKVAAAVAGYRAFLSGNELVALCDDNPFGVAVDLRGTLGGALDRIEAALAA